MNWTEKLNGTRSGLRNLNPALPDTSRAFGELNKAVKQSGKLDTKTKEFIALGISVADPCEPCTACISKR